MISVHKGELPCDADRSERREQEDVIALVSSSGTKVVEYTYDAWGKQLSCTGSKASTVGTVQPFRYRGYIYDFESAVYYLRSRYYNPEWGRFLNIDAYLDFTEILLSLFVYCVNNPIRYYDPNGCSIEDFIDRLRELFLGGGNCLKSYTRGMEIYDHVPGGDPNPGGRLGGSQHRAMTNAVKDYANGINESGQSVKDYGYEVVTEYQISGIKNGYKTTRFGDIGIIPNDSSLGGSRYIIQVGRATVMGSPVSREQRAISDIELNGFYVIFIPYNQ